MSDRIILCSNCGTKNRVPTAVSRQPLCGSCGKALAIGSYKRSYGGLGKLAIVVAIGAGLYLYNQLPASRISNNEHTPTIDTSNGSTTNPPVSTPEDPDKFLTPVRISPGVIKRPSSEPVAPLKLRTNPGLDYYVKLVNPAGRTTMSMYVRGGSDFETYVPLGTYELRYAAGETWYGEKHRFGSKTVYSKTDEKFDFTFDGNQYNGYTVELILRQNGNLQTIPLDESQF